ncbi:MAG: SRPBCC family protein [Actinobacteria bacterium]|nr:SRPBCC family protein [Actinomycetota bacterium]
MGNYRFGTRWVLQAPIDRVWDAIVETERWPTWWRGVQSADVLEQGAEGGVGKRVRYVFRSALPYTLGFEMVLREVSRPHLLVADASGELEGFGRWEITEDGGVTTLDYTWHVRTTAAAMNLLAPFVRPAFVWNHHVVMRWGAEGLARHLSAPLLGVESTPNPKLTDLLPLVGLMTILALAVRRWSRVFSSRSRG